MRKDEERDEWLRTRLREAVEKFAGGSADKLARDLGYTNGGYIREILARNKEVRDALLERFAQVPVMATWFELPEKHRLTLISSIGASIPDQKGTDVLIPQFNTGGAMGGGLVLRDQPGVIQSWRVTPEWVQKNVRSYSAQQNLCIVTGFGDSMKPMFNPGDPLLVDIGIKVVEYDAIYFFRVENEGFIKRLQRIPGEGLRVLSANRDNYEPWTVKPDMDFEVFGRVLKVWRSEEF